MKITLRGSMLTGTVVDGTYQFDDKRLNELANKRCIVRVELFSVRSSAVADASNTVIVLKGDIGQIDDNEYIIAFTSNTMGTVAAATRPVSYVNSGGKYSFIINGNRLLGRTINYRLVNEIDTQIATGGAGDYDRWILIMDVEPL